MMLLVESRHSDANPTHEKISSLFELEAEEVSRKKVSNVYILQSSSIYTNIITARSHENDLTVTK